jgi:putative SOS response-associated peptidase YedK
MCGRYRLTAKERWLAEYFNIDPENVKWTARWNVAPTDEVATVRQDRHGPQRIFGLMRWGMIPYWAKDLSIGAKTINAVCETAAEKPVFRESMKKRRCLIPADGFYEWKKIGPKKKQAFNIGMADDGLFRIRWAPMVTNGTSSLSAHVAMLLKAFILCAAVDQHDQLLLPSMTEEI